MWSVDLEEGERTDVEIPETNHVIERQRGRGVGDHDDKMRQRYLN